MIEENSVRDYEGNFYSKTEDILKCMDFSLQQVNDFIGFKNSTFEQFASDYNEDKAAKERRDYLYECGSSTKLDSGSQVQLNNEIETLGKRIEQPKFDYFKFLEQACEDAGKKEIATALKAFEESLTKQIQEYEKSGGLRRDIRLQKNNFWNGNRIYNTSKAFKELNEQDKKSLVDLFNGLRPVRNYGHLLSTEAYMHELHNNLKSVIDSEKDNHKKESLQEILGSFDYFNNKEYMVKGGVLAGDKVEDITARMTDIKIKSNLFLKEIVSNSKKAENIDKSEYGKLILVREIAEYADFVSEKNGTAPKYEIIDGKVQHPYEICENNVEKILYDYGIKSKEYILEGNNPINFARYKYINNTAIEEYKKTEYGKTAEEMGERARKAAEEKRLADEADKAKKEAEEAEKAKKEAEEAEKTKKEAEEAEKAKKEAEEAEKAKKEAEAAEKTKKDAEEVINKINEELHDSEKNRTDLVIGSMDKILEEIENSANMSSRNSDISGEMYKLAKSCTEKMKDNGTYLVDDFVKLSELAQNYLDHKMNDGINSKANGKIWSANAILKISDFIKNGDSILPELGNSSDAGIKNIMEDYKASRKIEKGKNAPKEKVRFTDLLKDEINKGAKGKNKSNKENSREKTVNTKTNKGLGKLL